MLWFKTSENAGRTEVFDPVRKKYVALTPEEKVRQRTLHQLVEQLGVPAGLVAVEHTITLHELKKRCDIVVFSKDGRPVMIVECKAAHIPIQQKTLEQAARYNFSLQVDYLLLTNGEQQYCCQIDLEKKALVFLDKIPDYDQMIQTEHP